MLNALLVTAALATESFAQSHLTDADLMQNLQANTAEEILEPEPMPVMDMNEGEDATASKIAADGAMSSDIAKPMPIWCDPYYGCGGKPDYSIYDIYSYTKDDVHGMVWSSLYQAMYPAMVFY